MNSVVIEKAASVTAKSSLDRIKSHFHWHLC